VIGKLRSGQSPSTKNQEAAGQHSAKSLAELYMYFCQEMQLKLPSTRDLILKWGGRLNPFSDPRYSIRTVNRHLHLCQEIQ
jgi:hypothetical protein